MYYFFGAGVNCNAAIEFFRQENIKAIIDNSVVRIGSKFEGIPVISFNDFQKVWNGETIVITAYVGSYEIVKQLRKAKIQNYYVCPYMQTGLFSYDLIFEICDLDNYSSIAIYDKNPVGEMIAYEIKKRKGNSINVYFVGDDLKGAERIKETDLLLNINEKYTIEGDVSGYTKIINLYKELEQQKNIRYDYLLKYKNLHCGKRCFIIGNGPSLSVQDLEKLYLSGEISFGSNKIYNIFNSTRWRPNYYVIGDSIVYSNNKGNIPLDSICFIRDFYGKSSRKDSVNWYPSKGERYYPGYPQFSDDLLQGVYGGRTVTYDMLQIAVYMGFKELYLLGVDFSWGEGKNSAHFYKNDDEDPLIKEAMKYKDEQRHAYLTAKRYADTHDIKIYNATRGGNLDIFERVSFDVLFSETY
ncbi:MAG: DUF115 domain-containing protein [Lachnospiraceae bacterium]